MLRSLKACSLAALTLAASGCDRVHGGDAFTKDLVADRNGKNIVLMFGASNGLEGVATDLTKLKQMFENPQLDFGFEVRIVEEARTDDFLKHSAKAAVDVGETGTLFWYYSGHGAEDGGKMFTADQDLLPWSDVGRAMKAARSTPMRRLIVMSDSCFSGNLVDGTEQVNNSISLTGTTSEQRAAAQADAMLGAFQGTHAARSYASEKLYDQLLVLSASRKTETSADAGAEMGGGFTYSMRGVLASMKQSAPSSTIRDFVQKTASETEQAFGHTPQYRADPEAVVLADTLFRRAGGASGGSGAGSSGGELFLGLSLDKGNEAFETVISAETSVTRVGICRGDKVSCVDAKRVDVNFGAGWAKNGRTLFRSVDNFAVTDGNVVTLLGFGSDGGVVTARAVQMKHQ